MEADEIDDMEAVASEHGGRVLFLYRGMPPLDDHDLLEVCVVRSLVDPETTLMTLVFEFGESDDDALVISGTFANWKYLLENPLDET